MEKAKPETSKRIKKLLVLFCLVFGIAILFFARVIYLTRNPYANINYKTFRPTKLPQDLSLQDGKLLLWLRQGSNIPKSSEVVFSIAGDATFTQFKPVTPLGCDERLSNQTCSMRTTPKGQQYMVTENANSKGEVWSKYFTLIKEGTWISIDLNGSHADIADAEWESAIDSLEPHDYDGLKVQKVHPGP